MATNEAVNGRRIPQRRQSIVQKTLVSNADSCGSFGCAFSDPATKCHSQDERFAATQQ